MEQQLHQEQPVIRHLLTFWSLSEASLAVCVEVSSLASWSLIAFFATSMMV